MIGSPKHDLQKVKQLVEERKVCFSSPSRSLNEVTRVYETTATPKSQEDAENFIYEGILKLGPGNFAGRVLQWEEVADVYGMIFDSRPWYVKFMVFRDEHNLDSLEEISFHPPKAPLPTLDGQTIPAEEVKS